MIVKNIFTDKNLNVFFPLNLFIHNYYRTKKYFTPSNNSTNHYEEINVIIVLGNQTDDF